MSNTNDDLQDHEHVLICPDCYRTPTELGYVLKSDVLEAIGEDEFVKNINACTSQTDWEDNCQIPAVRNGLRAEIRSALKLEGGKNGIH